jgi:SAM-dependent methyltransferase
MQAINMTYDPHAYWNRLVSGNLDLAKVGHAELGAYNRVAYRLRLQALENTVARVPFGPHLRVFEAAFGVGYYLTFFAKAGITQLTGVDLSSAAVTQARQAFPNYHLFQHDLTTPLPVPAGSFDLVTAIDVLYHIVDDRAWEQALGQLCALVAPGGHFVCTDKFPATQPYQKVPHVRRRPLAMYTRIFEEYGLALKTVRPVFVLMDDPLPFEQPRWLAQATFAQWRLVSKAIRSLWRWPSTRDAVALCLAGLQYPFEKIALRLFGRSPNLEIVLAQRSA